MLNDLHCQTVHAVCLQQVAGSDAAAQPRLESHRQLLLQQQSAERTVHLAGER